MVKQRKGSGSGQPGDQPPIQQEGNSPPSPSESAPRAVVKRPKTATAKSPQHLDPLWQLLEAKVGGREGLLAAALASTNEKAKALVQLLLDKNYRNWGTKKLALRAGLSAPDVVDMFRDQKWLEATLALHEVLPEIVSDAAVDARATQIPCELCKTSKVDESGHPCYACGGTGYLRKPGDKDKLAFVGEATGLVGKKGPFVQVNTQINNQQPAMGTSFSELMRKATVQVAQIEGDTDESSTG